MGNSTMTNNNKLTAKQAAEISDANSATIDVDEILQRIKEEAQKGERKLIVKDYQFGTGECYTTEDKYPTRCKCILKALRELGYSAMVITEARQFVDIWLEISW